MKKKLLALSVSLVMVFSNLLVVSGIESDSTNDPVLTNEITENRETNQNPATDGQVRPEVNNDSETSTPPDQDGLDGDSSQEGEETNPDETEPAPVPEVTTLSYRSHVQDLGWQNYLNSPAISGTEGRSLRLEAINIKLESNKYTGDINYSTHVQNIGWQKTVKNNQLSGTEGRSLGVEAIKINLTGEIAKHYDIYYRCHVQTKGWLGWSSNGEMAGTSGFTYRMEAIQIKLVAKDEENKPDTSKVGYIRTYNNNELTYNAHVQNIGNVPSVNNSQTIGTVGRGLRMEAMSMKLNTSSPNTLSGGIQYRGHVQDIGWSGFVSNGGIIGTTGKSKRLEAIQIRLTGEVANEYDIYYRCHVQNLGWLGWAMNGQSAGTEGLSYRLEAVQVIMQPKITTNHISNSNYHRSGKTGWFYEGGYKLYYQNGNLVTDTSNICDRSGGFLTKVNRTTNTVTVYARDGGNGYIVPVKAFTCSVGLNGATPRGTFRTTNKYRWHTLMGPSYGQYCTRIVGGILFHSVAGYNMTSYNLRASDYNKLGQAASHGCVRLCVRDAKWIYDNCSSGMTVVIYDDANPGPFGKPATIKIPANQNWDPTDPAIK